MENQDKIWAEAVWEKIQEKMSVQCDRMGEKIPYIPKDGVYGDMANEKNGIYWWTNGFWGGILWQLYNATGEQKYRQSAENLEKRLEPTLESFEGLDHDLGFLWLHTAVAQYRLTKNPKSRINGLHAANILAGRYNPNGEFIRAWNGDRTGWVIIDCLMNLPLLYWASEELKDPRFKAIANKHAQTAQKTILRQDGSCNHIVIFDAETGEYLDNPAGQGYASGSSWSRGQSWAIYGFALSYRYTKNEEYLNSAKKVAHYFIANLAVNDYLPVIDFRAPQQPMYYDSTAGVCAACGLMELAEHVSEYEKPLYQKAAVRILRAAEEKFCNWDTAKDSILGYGSACYERSSDREVPIIYGDYFFIEAILRMLGKDFLIW